MGRRKVRNVHRGLEEMGGLELGEKGLEGRRVIGNPFVVGNPVVGKKQLRGFRGRLIWKRAESSLSAH